MKTTYTPEEIDKAKRIVASLSGSKGGRNWWNNLSENERQERIKKMVESRKAKNS